MNMSLHAIRIIVSTLALGALLVAGSVKGVEAKVRPGDRAASFVSVKDGKGKAFNLSKYKDRVVVLTFGASWCKPCKEELPAFEALAKKYDSKKVLFVAVNIDSERSAGAAFMKKAGLKKVVALYDTKSSTVASYEPPTMPTTFIIERGIVKHMHVGYRKGDIDKLAKLVNKALK